MILGTLLARLENEAEADEAMEAMGDLVLYQKVAEAGRRYGETAGEYAACAASRFASVAQHEEWMGLIAAVERAEDPGKAALGRILQWALAHDESTDTVEPSDVVAAVCSNCG